MSENESISTCTTTKQPSKSLKHNRTMPFVKAKRQALEELPDNQRIPTNDVITKIALEHGKEYQFVKRYFMNKASARDRRAAGKTPPSVVAETLIYA